jgi:CRISPR/Cas system-associated exonuclease Cas4 (RecB family)
VKPMSHYSYSRLNLYSGCPRAYKCQYIEKRPQLPSEALDRGIAVHDAVAAYAKHCLAEGVMTDVDFLRSWQGTDEVREILETFADTHIFEPGAYTIEEMWKIQMEPHPWTWWGVIDLLKDEGELVRIEDRKTDHQLRSQTDINKDFQLRCYAWMAATKLPRAQEFQCAIDFVRYGVMRETTYTRDDISAIEKQIIDQIQTIEADRKYQATPGSSCSYCSYTSDCPAVMAGNAEIVSCYDEAGQAAAQLIALKARQKSLEDLLKPWCSQNGSIQCNGMEVGYVKSESFGYDTPDIIAFADEGRIAYQDVLQPNTTALKKLAKNPEYSEALAMIAIDKSKTNFKVQKGEAA